MPKNTKKILLQFVPGQAFFSLKLTGLNPPKSSTHGNIFLLVEFVNPDPITNNKVLDNIFISSSLMFC